MSGFATVRRAIAYSHNHRPGWLLLSDDVPWSLAFAEFCRTHRAAVGSRTFGVNEAA